MIHGTAKTRLIYYETRALVHELPVGLGARVVEMVKRWGEAYFLDMYKERLALMLEGHKDRNPQGLEETEEIRVAAALSVVSHGQMEG